ncbi:MAG: SPOR domain-containing protein [Bacteroidetes bacterium]|nr:SPOR domain-containing protein [Bacteroidota bacterium]
MVGATTPGWVIVVGSYTDPVEAEESAIRYRRILQSTSLDVKYWTDTSGGAPRYRLAVGHFGTAAEARQALRANAGRLPSDAWLLPVGQ